jgi:adenine-specific DNA-methyltransferase
LAAWFQNKKAHPCFSHRRFRYIDKRGAYKEDDPTAPGGRKFDLIHPETKNIIPLRSNRGWAFDQETFNSLVDEGRISFITDESIMVRRYLHETDQMTPQSVIYQPARSASERLNRLMGETAFDFPKDEIVIRRLIEMSTDEDSLVLDFFAGSGTTGHAVSDLNNLDGGKRAYILVQIPEIANTSAENGSKIRKISDMTIARNKKVAEKLPKGQNAGFKVFTLQKSYFPRTEWTPVVGMSEEEKLASLRAYIAEKESQQTFDYDRDKLLTEVLIKEGFKLTYKAVKRADFTDNEVYDVTDGNKQAVVCLDTSLNDKTVRQLRKLIDKKVVVIERALDTTKKWNLHNSLGEKFRAF